MTPVKDEKEELSGLIVRWIPESSQERKRRSAARWMDFFPDRVSVFNLSPSRLQSMPAND